MPLTDQLDRLARFEPVPYPVVSLYLNTQPNDRGRDQFQSFVRQEFKSRSQTYPQGSPDRNSLDKDMERIAAYLEGELQPSANGVAIFACDAAGLFETVQLNAPIEQHWLYIGDAPHLYPLARVESRYPRYAAVVTDTNSARIMVFATGELESQNEVRNEKTRRTSQGGWSQARFQRSNANQHQHHVKEVVEALDRIVTQEGIEQILTVGDEVVLPLLKAEMPKRLADKVVDHLKIDSKAPVEEILAASVEAMGRLNDQTDKEKVDAAIGGHRSGNLGVVGPEATLHALIKGQVDELLLSAAMDSLKKVSLRAAAMANDSTLMEPAVETAAGGEAAQADPHVVRLADEFVTRARNTSAKVTIIEDPALLQPHGGVAALLRFRI